ncbi:hypothetical protein PPMP20_04330 [Paraburkholderia phymatum]|uniref:DUF2188 domain-containing protein n=1 Tax=Paraburkholderia phymatum (strain DSM 17167 / CIP 108236 / LMG 21445 / STM815) TaxID=391038 RepID=B2JD28_PARP8|nr:hypothetical protein [Paraburkholderia phymatum]ACC71084.1 conserved hypothetical protein [Paraburkholderia phymatum STM815]
MSTILVEPNPFFLVWSPTGETPPSFKHQSRQSAVNEAERLARLHRGKKFYVLASTDSRMVDDRQRTTFTHTDEIPF